MGSRDHAPFHDPDRAGNEWTGTSDEAPQSLKPQVLSHQGLIESNTRQRLLITREMQHSMRSNWLGISHR